MQDNTTNNGETENRQYRGNPGDVPWLAGVLDGEGSIYAQLMPGCNAMRINVKIGNTSKLMLEKAARIIENVTYRKHKIAVNQRTYTGHLMYCIEVSSNRAIKALLEAVLPYLTVKKAQAEAMLSYCTSRASNRHWGKGYTPDELALPSILKALKRDVFDPAPGVVQTKRGAPTPVLTGQEGEAIVGANRNVG